MKFLGCQTEDVDSEKTVVGDLPMILQGLVTSQGQG